MPRSLLKRPPFQWNRADREVLEPASRDLTLFTRFYFDGWEPLPYQHFFYHAPQKRKLLVAGIRTGKTKGVAAGFLHYAFYHPFSRLANASISADQANIVYNDVIDFASRKRFQKYVEHVERHPYPLVRLVNGSEIWFRSVGYEAELWRGWEFDLINVDEAAYVTRQLAIETLKGRLLGNIQLPDGTERARAGLFSMTTSPRGKGWLFEEWKKGDPKYYGSDPETYLSLRARTRDNVHLTPEAIAELERDYTARMIQQELLGEFLDDEGCVFPYEQIIHACSTEENKDVWDLDEAIREWFVKHNAEGKYKQGDMDYYALDPEPGHLYVNSWDLGKKPTKGGRNAMVGGVFDITKKPWTMVAYRYVPGVSYGQAHEWIKDWDAKYSQGGSRVDTVIDATGKGDIVNERLEDEEHIEVEGLNYSGATKPQLVIAGQLAFEQAELCFPFIRRAVDQLQNYVHDDKDIPQDIVMMLCQAAWRARQRWGEGQKQKTVVKQTHARTATQDPSMDRYRARRSAGRSNWLRRPR